MKVNKAFSIGLLYALGLALIVSLAALAPKEGQPVLVVASPFYDNSAVKVVLLSKNTTVEYMVLPWMVTASSPVRNKDGLVEDLYSSGAWLVLDAGLVNLCL